MGDIQPAVQLALIGRYYERIGDHAVNIGERVRYMVDGWLPSTPAPRGCTPRSRSGPMPRRSPRPTTTTDDPGGASDE